MRQNFQQTQLGYAAEAGRHEFSEGKDFMIQGAAGNDLASNRG